MCVGGMSGWDVCVCGWVGEWMGCVFVCVGEVVKLKILRATERQADP